MFQDKTPLLYTVLLTSSIIEFLNKIPVSLNWLGKNCNKLPKEFTRILSMHTEDTSDNYLRIN